MKDVLEAILTGNQGDSRAIARALVRGFQRWLALVHCRRKQEPIDPCHSTHIPLAQAAPARKLSFVVQT
ncbi:MAG: hypothetical protein DWI25_01735 [Planctomycetota bacterium]|nr:MAG: hypothetical protein DWI25_01735 [Planctomycetota bacterium]